MSEILLIRHAETDMAGTFCGHSDPPLNARGVAQLPELISQLRSENIRTVYTSDLRRAHSTATAIADAFELDCRVQPALREVNFGQWEGLKWKEIEARDSKYAHDWIAQFPHIAAPGGEEFADFERRIFHSLEAIAREHEALNRPVAVVSHAGVISTVLRARRGLSLQEAWNQTKAYCSIVRLQAAELLSVPSLEEIS